MNADALSTTLAATLTFRQRNVRNLGVEIRVAVTEPEVMRQRRSWGLT